MRFKNLLFIISLILIIEGLSFLLCIPYAIYYHESLIPFYIPAVITLTAGSLLYTVSNKTFETITSNRERIVLITFSWLMLILVGTLPYQVSKTIPEFVDVFFETISGFTTTGSSILSDIEQLPKSILFWRSLTNWLGGIGTIIMLIAVFPSLNIGGYKLFSIEEKTVLNFRFVLMRVILIYCVLTITQVLLLYLGRMNLFDSLCHTFGTVSTGCFTPKNESIGGYSPYIQYIMVLFMFLSGASYVIYYLVLTGKFKAVKRYEEIRGYFVILISFALFISVISYFQSAKRFESVFRESIFQVTSFVTSTGYSVTDYLFWPDYILVLLFFLLLVGGCTVSASGGIKMSRFLILFKNFKSQFKYPNSPSNDQIVKYNGSKIDEETNLSILAFISVYGAVCVLGTIAISFFDNDFKKSAFLSISALSTFGHHLNLSSVPSGEKIILSFLMLLGRLEIYPLLLVFLPLFYRKTIKISE